ncbi:arsinothricin biosynthesis methyltransferase ArsM [Pseudomonas paraveronii]|uniref:arsinothricin biosynthesis methyltransferase ArsM n=1 Tax=Pseudomonas paraveronii TaxID=3040598 RepID=UPI002AB08D2A|nr:arsinothricin biosynthesis methyltransferase ArsM [Pseudomonas sp. V3/K/3/5]
MTFAIENTIIADYNEALSNGNVVLESQLTESCCSDAYGAQYLKNIPKRIIEANFGCGNPTKYVREGDVVLDLGSGAGLNCYVAAQIAGSKGAVFGIDINPSMLLIAREEANAFQKATDSAPLRFYKASASNLKVDQELAEERLRSEPCADWASWKNFEQFISDSSESKPLIDSQSVDLVISNCVINLVGETEKQNVFAEIFRVLKPGGRFAISDNVSDIAIPDELKRDTKLWSACYSGVLQEQDFYKQLQEVGLTGIKIEARNDASTKRIGSVRFYSVTVTGTKPEVQSGKTVTVIYRGPGLELTGDSGRVYKRGVPTELAAGDAYLSADDALYVVEGSQPVNPKSCCS